MSNVPGQNELDQAHGRVVGANFFNGQVTSAVNPEDLHSKMCVSYAAGIFLVAIDIVNANANEGTDPAFLIKQAIDDIKKEIEYVKTSAIKNVDASDIFVKNAPPPPPPTPLKPVT